MSRKDFSYFSVAETHPRTWKTNFPAHAQLVMPASSSGGKKKTSRSMFPSETWRQSLVGAEAVVLLELCCHYRGANNEAICSKKSNTSSTSVICEGKDDLPFLSPPPSSSFSAALLLLLVKKLTNPNPIAYSDLKSFWTGLRIARGSRDVWSSERHEGLLDQPGMTQTLLKWSWGRVEPLSKQYLEEHEHGVLKILDQPSQLASSDLDTVKHLFFMGLLVQSDQIDVLHYIFSRGLGPMVTQEPDSYDCHPNRIGASYILSLFYSTLCGSSFCFHQQLWDSLTQSMDAMRRQELIADKLLSQPWQLLELACSFETVAARENAITFLLRNQILSLAKLPQEWILLVLESCNFAPEVLVDLLRSCFAFCMERWGANTKEALVSKQDDERRSVEVEDLGIVVYLKMLWSIPIQFVNYCEDVLDQELPLLQAGFELINKEFLPRTGGNYFFTNQGQEDAFVCATTPSRRASEKTKTAAHQLSSDILALVSSRCFRRQRADFQLGWQEVPAKTARLLLDNLRCVLDSVDPNWRSVPKCFQLGPWDSEVEAEAPAFLTAVRKQCIRNFGASSEDGKRVVKECEYNLREYYIGGLMDNGFLSFEEGPPPSTGEKRSESFNQDEGHEAATTGGAEKTKNISKPLGMKPWRLFEELRANNLIPSKYLPPAKEMDTTTSSEDGETDSNAVHQRTKRKR